MRKGALLLAIVFAASLPTVASAAKKMPKDPAVQAQKDSTAFFTDALHPWAPTTPEPKAKGKKKK